MRLRFEEHAELPRLAWLLELRAGETIATIHHGPWVETAERFFCDGAWDGAFARGELAASGLLMGTGGEIAGDELVLSTACHPFDGLFVHRTGDRLRVSPSLPFLLQHANVRLAIDYIPYQARISETFQGLDHHVDSLPLAGGDSVAVYRMRNLYVGRDLAIRVQHKPDAPRFEDYASYHGFLVEGLRRIAENARSPERKHRYTMIATVSSGYDSVASAAVAAECGCTEAVTIRSARPEKHGASEDELDDSGAPVAIALGMQVEEFERDAYRNEPGFPEAEFMVGGDLGQDVVIRAFERHLPERLMITGVHGDMVWGLQQGAVKSHPLRRDLVRPSASTASISEFKMRVGFVHAPLPCFGALSFPDIHAISCSPEMKPWTLGTRYDRPIARRLAEERGVGRSLFGHQKRAVTILLNSAQRVRQQLGDASRRSFERFVAEHARERGAWVSAGFLALYAVHDSLRTPIQKANSVLARLGVPWRVSSPVPPLYRHDPGDPSFLVHWGLAHTMPRYVIEDGLNNRTRRAPPCDPRRTEPARASNGKRRPDRSAPRSRAAYSAHA